MNKIFQKEQCERFVGSFNAKSRHFKNFLHFYVYSSFEFILSHKFQFSKNVFFFLLLYHRCRLIQRDIDVFNNRNINFCNFCNIWYSQSFQNCSTFIFLNAIFIWAGYLFTLLWCLTSSSLSSLRLKFRIIYTCLNIILYISMLLLYVTHFWLYEIVLKLSSDIEENLGTKPSSNQSF